MKKGVSIILHSNEKVLMQLRDDSNEISYPNYWCLFGGHAEEGETPEKTVIRELGEELNLHIKSPRLFATDKTYHTYESDYFKEYVFAYKIDSDTSRLIQKEGQAKKFFSLEEIEKIKVVPWQLSIIKRFFAEEYS